MSKTHFDLETFLPYRLSITAHKVSQQFADSYRKNFGLNRAQWRIICHLSELQEGESISVRDLERQVHLEKSKVSRAVTQLQDRGILTKSPDERDARLLAISLTPKGKKIFSEIVPLANQYQSQLAAKLSQADMQKLMEILEDLSKTRD